MTTDPAQGAPLRDRLAPYLGSLDALVESMPGETGAYVLPARKRLGSVSIVLLREIIAPAVFRNQEAEITDVEIGPHRLVRATPGKFKHKERARGLQILRHFGAGGRFPQNKTACPKGVRPGEVFDLNTLVFGDSAMQDKRMLPVKAGVLCSDALSLADYEDCVSATFHVRSGEEGVLFDPERKVNPSSLFERHVVAPGTLMVQTLSTHGRTMPVEAFEHLLLCVGQAGSYGGQTSMSGVNVRTRIAAIVAGRVERPNTVPGELVKALRADGAPPATPEEALERLAAAAAEGHELVIAGAEATEWQAELTAQLETDAPAMAARYTDVALRIADLFDAWFTNEIAGKPRPSGRGGTAA